MNSVAISSGGLDSTTLIYEMMHIGYVPHVLSFDYGQRHAKELKFAKQTAEDLKLQWDLIPIHIASLLARSHSSLVDPMADVPEGHYAQESMKHTVVPNRNMVMLSIAAAVGIAEEVAVLGIGVHAGDHFIYPDCRPEFIRATQSAITVGNEGFGDLHIYSPFIKKTKTDIARLAMELGVPIEQTWSCYKGGDFHCGRCGTCVERQEAIWEADPKFEDPTIYLDTKYWKTVTKLEGVNA